MLLSSGSGWIRSTDTRIFIFKKPKPLRCSTTLPSRANLSYTSILAESISHVITSEEVCLTCRYTLVVEADGIEPPTHRCSDDCSTYTNFKDWPELHFHIFKRTFSFCFCYKYINFFLKVLLLLKKS